VEHVVALAPRLVRRWCTSASPSARSGARTRSASTWRPRVGLRDRRHRNEQRGGDQEGPYHLAPSQTRRSHHVSVIPRARRRGLLSPRRRLRPGSTRCVPGSRETDDGGTVVCVSSVRSCPTVYRRDRMRTDLTPPRRAVWWREAGQRARSMVGASVHCLHSPTTHGAAHKRQGQKDETSRVHIVSNICLSIGLCTWSSALAQEGNFGLLGPETVFIPLLWELVGADFLVGTSQGKITKKLRRSLIVEVCSGPDHPSDDAVSAWK
jgi:hypothetical protein